MRRVVVMALLVMFGIGLWPAAAAGQATGAAAPAAPGASLSEDEATAKWKRAVNARLDEMVKEPERTGNPRVRELAQLPTWAAMDPVVSGAYCVIQ
jgi:hypothetical protein